jgi:stage II sporulation protein M
MNYKWWVVTAVLLFGIGFTLGLATPSSITGPISRDIENTLKEIGSMVVPFSVLTAVFIFVRNATALLISFALSPIFCLVPILALTLNGWVIAFVSTTVVQEKSLGFVLAGLLPHGIIELPAFIIGEAAALSFGAMLIAALFKKRGERLSIPRLKQSLKYLIIALALLLPAAIIETFVTPLLLIP